MRKINETDFSKSGWVKKSGLFLQKSNSLWGAVLFHAAGDCLILFPAFASM